MRKSSIALILALFMLTGCGGKTTESTSTADRGFITVNSDNVEETESVDMEKIFDCDAQRLDKGISPEEMTRLYLEAFAKGKEKGYTPVVVFANDRLEEAVNIAFNEENTPEAYVKAVLSKDHTNGKELFDEKYAYLEELFGDELMIDSDELDMMLSVFENSDMNKFLMSDNSFEGEVYLVQVPTNSPYEIFAWLPFCGWNDCPNTNDMIAMCRYWYDEYGAVPAEITYDTLTFYLNEPITDKETAVKAAKEQCVFSSEVIGMGGIFSYVRMTLDGNIWTFWWD